MMGITQSKVLFVEIVGTHSAGVSTLQVAFLFRVQYQQSSTSSTHDVTIENLIKQLMIKHLMIKQLRIKRFMIKHVMTI